MLIAGKYCASRLVECPDLEAARWPARRTIRFGDKECIEPSHPVNNHRQSVGFPFNLAPDPRGFPIYEYCELVIGNITCLETSL
jgi:hypothetical protein